MSFLKRSLYVLAAVGILSMPLFAAPQLDAHRATVSAPAPTPTAPGHAPVIPMVPFGLGGLIKIKDTGALAQKFATRAGAASGDYGTGVAGAGQDWQQNTLASKDSYVQGVQASIADGRFEKGVQDAGAQKYTQNATTVGPQRYQQGVANAAGAWAKGVQPHLDAMKNADLGPRGPKGSAQNQQRAAKAAALNRSIKLGK